MTANKDYYEVTISFLIEGDNIVNARQKAMDVVQSIINRSDTMNVSILDIDLDPAEKYNQIMQDQEDELPF